MTSRPRIALVAASVALVTLRPTLVDSPQMKEAGAPAPVNRAALVRVEHEMVSVPIITELAPRPLRAAPRRAPASNRTSIRPSDRPQGLVSRARQLLLGDGQYRPEPFPRAGQ